MRNGSHSGHGEGELPKSSWTAFEFDGGLVLLGQGRELRVYDETAAALWLARSEGIAESDLLVQMEQVAGADARAATAELFDQWQADPAGKTTDTIPELIPAKRDNLTRWATCLGGVHVEFHVDPALIAWIQSLLTTSADDCSGQPLKFELLRLSNGECAFLVDSEERLRTDDPDLLHGAIYQACLDHLYDKPVWQALIHGGGVALGSGAIGLPARSGDGKSTLTALLVARGFRYVADDLLAVLPDSRIAPWPIALSVKPGSIPLLAPFYGTEALSVARTRLTKGVCARLLPIPPEHHAVMPVPLKAMVFPRYDPAGDNRLVPLRPLHALARLASDRLWIGYPISPQRTSEFLDWLAVTPTYEISHCDVALVDDALRALLGECPA